LEPGIHTEHIVLCAKRHVNHRREVIHLSFDRPEPRHQLLEAAVPDTEPKNESPSARHGA
jgi:hypothetical protein